MALDALSIVAITAVLAVTAASALKVLRRGPKLTPRARERRPESLASIDMRLDRLEQSIDVIAVEVERIGESQRYLTRVLANQLAPDQDRRPEG